MDSYKVVNTNVRLSRCKITYFNKLVLHCHQHQHSYQHNTEHRRRWGKHTPHNQYDVAREYVGSPTGWVLWEGI